MEETTNLAHDLMRQYFKAYEGFILCEYVETVKSSGGVFLASPEKSIGHPIVSVGPKVEDLKEGDWVVLQPNTQINTFNLFERKWFYVRTFDVMSTVDPAYLKADEDFKKNKAVQTKSNLLVS
jgi:hypothetical protein